MTIEEAEQKVPIGEKDLRNYINQGLLQLENLDQANLEKELLDIQVIDSLAKIGAGPEELKQLKNLMKQGIQTRDEQFRILRRCRFQMVDDIHVRQQSLDRIDYMIYTMKQNKLTTTVGGKAK